MWGRSYFEFCKRQPRIISLGAQVQADVGGVGMCVYVCCAYRTCPHVIGRICRAGPEDKCDDKQIRMRKQNKETNSRLRTHI